MNARELIASTEKILLTQAHCTLEAASPRQLHEALASACMLEMCIRDRGQAASINRPAFVATSGYLAAANGILKGLVP